MIEGSRVAYTGERQDLLAPGDSGRLLAISGDSAHVLFSSGQVQGAVRYVALGSLVALEEPVRSLIADSLDAPEALSSTAVRETVATSGEQGLLHALGEAGVLDELASIAEEAADFVAGRVRSDPSLAPVMAVLDADERDDLITLTSALLLRNAAHEDGADE